jgi:poly(ADP-ribose) glycohydrolase ARH3
VAVVEMTPGITGPVLTSDPASWRLRVCGSLVLAACADALGPPFAGRPYVDAAEAARALESPTTPMRWTAGTAQSLVLAEHLIEYGSRVEPDALAAALAAAWEAEPGRGYSPGAKAVLSQIAAGVPWPVAAAQVIGGGGSWGNGAAMRVAPVGLLPARTLDEVARVAAASARITHCHPLGIDGAVAQAVAVAVAARSPWSRRLDAAEVVAAVAAHVTTAEFADALRAVPHLASAPVFDVAARFSRDSTALGSVPVALAVFLRHPDDPVDAITEAISLGGETDAIAAMTGALVGARCGESTVPPAWELHLDQPMRLWAAAGRLARLGPRR